MTEIILVHSSLISSDNVFYCMSNSVKYQVAVLIGISLNPYLHLGSFNT